jgi:hypothetical protein
MDAMMAGDVAGLVTIIAPCFVARMGDAGHLPQREPPDLTIVVASVELSLPLVAVTNRAAVWPGIEASKLTALHYVRPLFGMSITARCPAVSFRA